MHALAPYDLQVFDRSLPGPNEQKYHLLDHVLGHDLLDLIESYLTTIGTDIRIIVEDKRSRALRSAGIVRLPFERAIEGFIQLGTFGMSGQLVNVTSGATSFQKSISDSDFRSYFFRIILPGGGKRGLILFHTIEGDGIKTLFLNGLIDYLQGRIGSARLRVNGITAERALSRWLENAQVKAIKLKNFHGNGSADFADRLGSATSELIYRPSKRSGSLGRMVDFFRTSRTVDADGSSFLAAAATQCDQVRVEALLGSKRRTFSMQSTDFAASIDVDTPDVVMIQGLPEPESLKIFARTLSAEILKAIGVQT